MGRKGRAKRRTKQTGKKRTRGKRTASSGAAGTKTLERNINKNYVGDLADYEPIRKGDTDDEEVEEVEEQDLKVLRQSDLTFLTHVNLENDFKNKVRKRKALENIEESYEKQPRLAGESWKPRNQCLLPVKDRSGVIQQSIRALENDNSVKDANADSCPNDAVRSQQTKENDNPAAETLATIPVFTVDLLRRRKEEIDAKKASIANLVSAILEDPYANVEKLNEMNKLCADRSSSVSGTVRKLALVSQLEVIKDIIPGYHIRPLSESERNTKVSKDVKKIRKFEEGLLKGYQRYLVILEETVKEKRIQKRFHSCEQKSLPMLALSCLCDLLKSVPHFNYRTNIMAVLVPKMNDISADGQVSKLCCETIHSVFKADFVGEVSLEIVQLISKFVKSRSFKVKAWVLETFLSLRLHDADMNSKEQESGSGKTKSEKRMEKARKKKMSKNDRKRQKELKKIERELQEAEVVEGKAKSRKLAMLKTSGVCPLLAPVLAGLSKYTHLINVDFFADLMSVLQGLVKSEEMSSSDKLHCILTAFKILSGQGAALNIDPQAFYSHLYVALLNVSPVSTDSDISVALECLDVMLTKRRKQVSVQRLLAYIKRLCTMALQQHPSTSLALLSCARSFLELHAKTKTILDSDCAGRGLFRPDIPDPEYSNADSTTLWELPAFRNHYEPTVRNFALNISLGSPSQGPDSLPTHLTRKNPLELFAEFREDRQSLSHLNNCEARATSKHKTTQHGGHSLSDWNQTLVERDVNNCFMWMDEERTDVDFATCFLGRR